MNSPQVARLLLLPVNLFQGVTNDGSVALLRPDGTSVTPHLGTQFGSQGTSPDGTELGVRPQDDFYRFVNHAWFSTHSIPAGEPVLSAFGELRGANKRRLQELLDEVASSHPPHGSAQQKLADFCFSGMDEGGLNAAGAAPLAPFLGQIANLSLLPPEALEEVFGWLLRHKFPSILKPFVDADPQQSSQNILTLDQDGLGLPDCDYYLREDEHSVRLRLQYQDHIAETFMLLGDTENAAREKAAWVMAIETELARASLTAVERRDLQRQYNKMDLPGLKVLTPYWDWDMLFSAMGIPEVSHVIVTHPEFFKAVNRLARNTPTNHWQAYLTWQWINGASEYLGDRFADHKFGFCGKVLEGIAAQKPRWQRVLEQADMWLGDALGQAFVKRHFPESSKRRLSMMVDDLIEAFRDRIRTRDWMGDGTKEAALCKLDRVAQNIGFPNQWKDYSSVQIVRDSYLGNVLNARQYKFGCMVAKLAHPVDRNEWTMAASTVNAEYDFSRNRLLFSAGILQPPFFDSNADDAVNYGAIGAIIGHELTHGFDDQGALFDADGNMCNWWMDGDKAGFDARAARLVGQFDAYRATDKLYVNGRLTLGENIADLGGLVLAYDALQRSLAGRPRPLIDGFTPEQRFFMSWARIWRIQFTPPALDKYVRINPHSPGRFRVIGPLSNMDAFHKAWGTQPGDTMWRDPEDRVEIW